MSGDGKEEESSSIIEDRSPTPPSPPSQPIPPLPPLPSTTTDLSSPSHEVIHPYNEWCD